MTASSEPTLNDILQPIAQQVEQDLSDWLTDDDAPPELAEAMRYAVLGGGKRLRPGLVYLAAQAVGGEADPSVRR